MASPTHGVTHALPYQCTQRHPHHTTIPDALDEHTPILMDTPPHFREPTLPALAIDLPSSPSSTLSGHNLNIHLDGSTPMSLTATHSRPCSPPMLHHLSPPLGQFGMTQGLCYHTMKDLLRLSGPKGGGNVRGTPLFPSVPSVFPLFSPFCLLPLQLPFQSTATPISSFVQPLVPKLHI